MKSKVAPVVWLPVIGLAWLIPGGGHFFLKRHTRGALLAAAVAIAKQLGPGHTIVTILCDSGSRYQSRIFNREWLAAKGLSVD